MQVLRTPREKGRVVPPPPLVTLKHPAKWAVNMVQLLGAAAVLAYYGTQIIAGLYYLCFEVNPTITSEWHHLIADGGLRHNIRDIGEGFLGGLLAKQVIWNHYKRRSAQNRLDKLEVRLGIANVKDEKRLSVWQLMASPPLAVLYAIPGLLVASAGIYLFHRYGTHLHGDVASLRPKPTTLWSKVNATWTQNWQKKVLGYGASLFFGRRPVKGVFDDVQLWFAEQLVINERPVRWYHPPTFRARCNDVRAHGMIPPHDHGFWRSALMRSGFALSLGLAAFGFYVTTFIATS
ncbi:MAG: hypothetical protein M3063_02125 [Actinomycetota bacterium]|nr:hypothetical protein [Actinomycetota bacterium]